MGASPKPPVNMVMPAVTEYVFGAPNWISKIPSAGAYDPAVYAVRKDDIRHRTSTSLLRGWDQSVGLVNKDRFGAAGRVGAVVAAPELGLVVLAVGTGVLKVR